MASWYLYSDYETFVSADDLRINLWNLEVSDQCFNIIDMKPSNMEDLTGSSIYPWLLAHSNSCMLSFIFRHYFLILSNYPNQVELNILDSVETKRLEYTITGSKVASFDYFLPVPKLSFTLFMLLLTSIIGRPRIWKRSFYTWNSMFTHV